MPFFEHNGFRTHYELQGVDSLPVLLLSNSLGTNLSMWEGQREQFEKYFRLLRYDTRGHGESSVTPGPYQIELLAQDVIHLLDHLQIPQASFCGLSMGGMIGISLGINWPKRLHKLVLCNTAAKIGTAEFWSARIEKVEREGTESIAQGLLERWFTPSFLSQSLGIVATTKRTLLHTSAEGYAACCAAVRDGDFREDLKKIRVPTLIVSGALDPVIPMPDVQFLVKQIPEAQHLELQASHLSAIEAKDAFNKGVLRFLGH